ncbi:unnamed protein product [Moneuplotes crassus]|uniref:Uncharacterized protein n=2 Tax=Euplotes crassus TaxID=5936 RepID=A0AAD1Y5Q8_EUPCR|nr:unnamed protein product [Moneuplotes crassus]
MDPRQDFTHDPIYKSGIVRKATEDPNKFSQGYSQQESDVIPGESDRDRRLRLRAMERKSRLGSAKSTYSTYSNPPAQDPPHEYQENLKFPENTKIESGFVQPARQADFESNREIKPQYKDYGRDEGNRDYHSQRSENDYRKPSEEVASSAETLRKHPESTEPQTSNPEMGIHPGIAASNDIFRQKQADMKRQMQEDFQKHLNQNKNIDPRRARIQKQREAVSDPDYYSANTSDTSSRRKQIADDVFSEIMSGKAPQIPQKTVYSEHNDRVPHPSHPEGNFMFKGNEEDELRQKKLKQKEYGEVLRSQMGSAKSRRPQKYQEDDYRQNQDSMTVNDRSHMPKYNKDEYRMELQRQIEERKKREQDRQRQLEEEDLKYQRNVESNIQQPGMKPGSRPVSNYSQRPDSDYNYNQHYARQHSITNQKEETPEQIAKKMQYQAELKAQIEERNRIKKMKEQEEKNFEEIQERRKIDEQRQLHEQYCREENKHIPDTQGRPLDVNNRNKYFEPSENNPIMSSGIKRVAGTQNVQQNNQFSHNEPQYPQNPHGYIESERTNPSTVRQPEINYPSHGIDQNEGFTKPPPVQAQPVQEYQSQPVQEYPSQPQQMMPPQFNPQMNPAMMQAATGQGYDNDPRQMNLMIEEQKKMIELYQNTLQQVIDLQRVIKDTHQTVAGQPQQNEIPPSPVKQAPKVQPQYHEERNYSQPQNPKVDFYAREAEKSSSKLSTQLKGLYGELGTMLAKKQQEMDGESKFVSTPAGGTLLPQQKNSEFLDAPTYKFDQSMNQSLCGSSKFVKIYDQDPDKPVNPEESKVLKQMVETWKSSEFDGDFERDDVGTPLKMSTLKRPKKFTNYKATDPEEEEEDDDEEIDENIKSNRFEEEEIQREQRLKSVEKQFREQEDKWKEHQEVLDAKKMLSKAMEDADLLMQKEQDHEDLDKLATDTHQVKQINKIENFNKDLDEIEEMIKGQNESNLKRKPMENSMSTIKSSKNDSVIQSKRDPFDMLEDVAQSVDKEELRKTAKSHKSKRKPWGTTKGKVPNLTDYHKERNHEQPDEEELDDEQEDIQEDEQEDIQEDEEIRQQEAPEIRQSKKTEVRSSGRYDYDFENTKEREIYEQPDPNEDQEEDYNIANQSVDNSKAIFSPDNLPRDKARTQENFNKNYMTGFSEGSGLNQEIWQQNLEALKTNYLRVMTQNRDRKKKLKEYNFKDSTDDFKRNIPLPNTEKKAIPHAVAESEYEKFRRTFQDDKQESQPQSKPKFDMSIPKKETLQDKEVVMDQPKYGEQNKSIEEVPFIKTKSDNKSIDIEAETFNWDDDEEVKSPSKINIGQEDEDYDNDFEEEVIKSNDSTPKRSTRKSAHKSSKSKATPKPDTFTEEEEDIIDKYEFSAEKDKLNTMQKQEQIPEPKMANIQSICSKSSNKINEYLTRRSKEGTFNVEEIIKSRIKDKDTSEESKKNVINPFKKLQKKPDSSLRSYKQAREEKQKNNLQNQIDEKIANYDSTMVDKLANLMNMFEIGESMPMVEDLQGKEYIKDQNNPSSKSLHSKDLFKNAPSEVYADNKNDSEFDKSFKSNNQSNNPFIMKNDPIEFWEDGKHLEKNPIHPSISTDANQRGVPSLDPNEISKSSHKEVYQLPSDNDDEDEDLDFPAYMKDNNPFARESGLKRPLSSKQSERYSKC